MSENVSEEEAETDREVGETEEVVKRGPEKATMGYNGLKLVKIG